MTKIFKTTKDELYHGCVELRDYLVKPLMESGESVKIKYKNEIREFTNEQIKYYYDSSKSNWNKGKDIFKSKFNNETYKLVRFTWNKGMIKK